MLYEPARANVTARHRMRHTRAWVVQLGGHRLEVVCGRHDGGVCSGVLRGELVTVVEELCAAVLRRSDCVVRWKLAREGALVGGLASTGRRTESVVLRSRRTEL
jgi:hypothetical protein